MKRSYKLEKEKRDSDVYRQYKLLIESGVKKMEVIAFLMHKYKIFSRQTIYNIIKRQCNEN